MEGFFKKEELGKVKDPYLSCISCGLYRGKVNPKMEPYGNFSKGIMLIGEFPGKAEDKVGIPWQGGAGRFLKKNLERLGIDLFEDCVCINAVNCRVERNHQPSKYEVDCCRVVKVHPAIKQYSPSVIILMGRQAILSAIGDRWIRNLGGMDKWRGWAIPDDDLNAWLCPMFSPLQVLREDRPEVRSVWMRDLEQAIKLINKPFPKYKEPEIQHMANGLRSLTGLKHVSAVSFDYECTGLKPHAKRHEIVCCAIAMNSDFAYTFLLPNTKKECQPLIDLLIDGRIMKIAANIKYEDTWSVERLFGTEINGWWWDTMLAAHVLDNRPGVTGLKFQAYVNFGIVDYDSSIAPYLKAKTANDHNKVRSLIMTRTGQKDLLQYCGIDAVLEYRLAMLQMQQMNFDQKIVQI